jgi:hypothetical protein
MDQVSTTKQLQAALTRDRHLAGDEPIKDEQTEKGSILGCGTQSPEPGLQPVGSNQGLAPVSAMLIGGKIPEELRVRVEQLDDPRLPTMITTPRRAWLSCAEESEVAQVAGLPLEEAREPAPGRDGTSVLPSSKEPSPGPSPDETSLAGTAFLAQLTMKPVA